MVWWTQGVPEARPPACHAGALPLSYVSVVVMGGFDPPPRAFQARALPTELHDHGAGPGTRTRIDWVTKPAPIPLGPAGIFSGSRSRCVVWKGSFINLHESQRGWSGVPRYQHRGKVRRVVAGHVYAILGADECESVASHMSTSFQVVREEGVEPSSQGPKPCVLTLDDSRAGRWRGQWVPPPLLVGGSHACICQHLDPGEQ